MSDLTLLIYISRATERMDIAALETLGRQSAKNNQPLDITGLLMTVGDHYLQVLEGPAAPLLKLVDTIREDRRHEQFRVILTRPAEARLFEQWSMRFLSLDDRLYVGLPEIAVLRDATLMLIGNEDAPKEAMLTLLRTLPQVMLRFEAKP